MSFPIDREIGVFTDEDAMLVSVSVDGEDARLVFMSVGRILVQLIQIPLSSILQLRQGRHAPLSLITLCERMLVSLLHPYLYGS
jgi:hypothetical protein